MMGCDMVRCDEMRWGVVRERDIIVWREARAVCVLIYIYVCVRLSVFILSARVNV